MNRWKDWYEQGKRDYERTLLDIQYGCHEWACFTFQQSVEKVSKALGFSHGFTVWSHSLAEMLKLMAEKINVPSEILDRAKLLDLFYIHPRYPNGFPSREASGLFYRSPGKRDIECGRSVHPVL